MCIWMHLRCTTPSLTHLICVHTCHFLRVIFCFSFWAYVADTFISYMFQDDILSQFLADDSWYAHVKNSERTHSSVHHYYVLWFTRHFPFHSKYTRARVCVCVYKSMHLTHKNNPFCGLSKPMNWITDRHSAKIKSGPSTFLCWSTHWLYQIFHSLLD